jgi:hypothetical protein
VATSLRALLALIAVLVAAVPAHAAAPWPPAEGPGSLFIHFGEEHWNDDDSNLTLPKVVAEVARYRPDLVTMSGDKANDGTVDQLSRWKEIMGALDSAGVPYFAGVGNHDRTAPPGVLPGTAGLLTPGIQGSLANYKDVFKDRPYPMGDTGAPAGDPAGASSHYFVDSGNARWIFLDNSCWGLSDCDSVQSPPFPDSEGIDNQFDYLERKGREATAAGKVVFVVMHIPTRDPRDQSYIDTTSFNHVMGKGLNPTQAPDNQRFEEVAERGGVDGVFLGHIKGQWTYVGRGAIPYYVDGGAGGELYTDGPVGVDHGYWHGFRLVRVEGDRIETDVVPIFEAGAITIRGPSSLVRGRTADFTATGKQPKRVGRRLDAFELRDPDPIPRQTGGLLPRLGDFLTTDGGFVLVPAALLALLGLMLRLESPRRRLVGAAPAVAIVAVSSVALAQQSEPTSTPKESLPNPARIWTSGNPFVLAPVASNSEDPRRDRTTQTQDGSFRARCPGTARLTITSGFEEAATAVRVPSASGRIVRSIKFRGRAARVRLAQPAEVIVRVKRGRRTLREVRRACVQRRFLRVRWDGRVARSGKLRKARPGRYRLQVLVRSDRRPIRRSHSLRVGG